MTRFLCTGDLHLGAGADYGRHPGDRLADQQQVWQDIVALAADRKVDAILFAGDAFEGPLATPEQLHAFAAPLRQLDGQIPVVAISGNGKHDSAMRDRNALEIFDGLISVASTPRVELLYSGHEEVAVALLPWAPPSRLVAAAGGGDRDRINEQAAELVLAIARGLRAEIPAGVRAILMLHWSVSGAALPNGLPVDMAREPILDIRALEELGYDAIVCGHIHKPQLLSTGALVENGNGSHVTPRPSRIFYVGSPMPLNFGEAGCDHGVWILDDAGGELRCEFVPIESRRFVTVGLDVDETHGSSLDSDEDITGAIVKVRYTATEEQARRVDHAQVRQALLDAGAHRVYAIQPDIIRSSRARVDGVDEQLEPLAALDLWLDAEDTPAPQRDPMRELTRAYLEAVGA